MLLIVLRLVFSSVRKKLAQQVVQRFDKNEIVRATLHANSFGERSKGGRQIRGNGALVVTKDAICFLRAAPFKEYTIPVTKITDISMPRSFNGKSVFAKLFCIEYETDNGTDAMAWALKDLESWKLTLEEVMSDSQ